MAYTKPPKDYDMVRLTVGYQEFFLPVAPATEVMRLLNTAEPVTSSYNSDSRDYDYKPEKREVTVRSLPFTTYAAYCLVRDDPSES